MKSANLKKENQERRRRRTRAKISGTVSRPRLSVFKSNRYIYASLIDDENGRTLASVSSHSLGKKGRSAKVAEEVGRALAVKAKNQAIKKAVFDRGPYRYGGAVRLLAEGARKGGMEF
ncbi:MAG: 50S ribosomal protein L18 [Candidatus Taylorbacteria bacterium]|nr:50S ribosomal protein L18 [Candidatus Taylorbacteria bacterium]